nr:GGDEF domain-containing protein [uncultured Sphaerochaeta sp.]
METLLRIQILTICLLLLGFAYAATSKKALLGNLGNSRVLYIYHWFIFSTAVILLTDLLAWMLDGVPGKGLHVLLLVNHTIYYAFHTLPTTCYILYADLLLHEDPKRLRRWQIPLTVLVLAIAFLSLASPFTGWFFTLDAQNVYRRGSLFMLFSGIQLLLLLSALLPLFGSSRRGKPRIYWTLVFFPFIGFIGGLLQSLFYGLVLIWPVTTVFLVAAALNIQKEQIGIDHLTGISNRLWFDEVLQRALRSVPTQKTFACILMDLDGFKQINDTLGHDVGDQALQEMARILRRVAGPDDVITRYGGDEFAVLLHDTNETLVQAMCDRIETEVALGNKGPSKPYMLSVSMGCAIYDPARFSDDKAFLSYLDAAMYEEKRTKLNTRR